jgi:hypothetical protein
VPRGELLCRGLAPRDRQDHVVAAVRAKHHPHLRDQLGAQHGLHLGLLIQRLVEVRAGSVGDLPGLIRPGRAGPQQQAPGSQSLEQTATAGLDP